MIVAPITKTGIAMSSLMPSSIETLAKAHTFAFWAYVFLLLLTALATVWLWLAGNKYQDAVKADADARIAEANKSAAGANERAEKLENANLTLRGKVANLEIQVEQQRERAAKAERDLEIIKRQMPPPRLPKEFSDALRGSMRGVAYIRYREGDVAGLEFANELSNTFKNHGWGPRDPEVGSEQLFEKHEYRFLNNEDVILIGRQMLGPNETNPVLHGLENAFKKGGFNVTMRFNQEFGVQDVLVLIGSKPGGPKSWRRIT